MNKVTGIIPRFSSVRVRSGFVLAALLCALPACQPQTRRDRASVGPDVAPTADAGADSAGDAAPAAPADSGDVSSGSAVAPDQWESVQRTLCEQGKPSGCSSLAYEALRGARVQVAADFFVRACLVGSTVSQCSAEGPDSRGLARSCFELVQLFTAQGRRTEAAAYANCACLRGYKPACGG